MKPREFAISQALARAALVACAALPEKHLSRGVVLHQVNRLKAELQGSTDAEDRRNGEKIEALVEWFEAGAHPSTDRVVLSNS